MSTTQMGTVYVEQADGSKVIPGSKRPDGTVRKAIRVKEGYTPGEENKYESKGQKMAQRSAYPPGYAPPDAAVASAPQRIPGLPDDYVAAGAKKAAKKKNKPEKKPEAEQAEEPVQPKVQAKAPEAKPEPVKAEKPEVAEPEKRLKNVKKKLGEIEALEAKPKGSLSADQQKKVDTKAEFEAESRYLEKVLAGQARGMKPADAAAAAQKQQKKKGPAEAPVVLAKAAASPEPVVVVPQSQPKAKAAKPEAKKEKVQEKAVPAAAPTGEAAADAAKRLRNVKKKIAEIERLEGSGTALTEDQKAKVSRKKELEVECKMLEKQVK